MTPFALVNDAARRVTPVLDEGMLAHDPLNYHPLKTTAPPQSRPAICCALSRACGHAPRIVDMMPLEVG